VWRIGGVETERRQRGEGIGGCDSRARRLRGRNNRTQRPMPRPVSS